MKKILSQNEIAFLYFKEHEEKTNLVGKNNSGTLRTINESSLHFRTFKVKHFFLNQWKHFLNRCELKFFPEFVEPRFIKTRLVNSLTEQIVDSLSQKMISSKKKKKKSSKS